jgi:hypothetical protein
MSKRQKKYTRKTTTHPLLYCANKVDHVGPEVASRFATIFRAQYSTDCGCTNCHNERLLLAIVVSVTSSPDDS